MSRNRSSRRQNGDTWTAFSKEMFTTVSDGKGTKVKPVEISTSSGSFGYGFESKEIWSNNRYQVVVDRMEPKDGTGLPEMVHLSIKSHGREPIKDWRDLQRIKNELCGTACEAVELYPCEERLVDTSNQFHLWVLSPGLTFPFGFSERLVLNNDMEEQMSTHKAKQRRIEDHHTADELLPIGPVWAHVLDEGD